MKSLNVLVVDDESLARKRIIGLLGRRSESLHIKEASDCHSAEKIYEKFTPDLLFLDIHMPELDGFALLGSVSFDKTKVIFQTAYSEYAARAFEVNATNYLLKPFSQSRFDEVFDLAVSEIQRSDEESYLKYINVKIGRIEKLVPIDEVLYFDTKDHSTFAHLSDRVYSQNESLQHLEERLDPDDFIRIHRNTIVNRLFIETWTRTYPMIVTMKNGDHITVSKERRKKVREFFLKGCQ